MKPKFLLVGGAIFWAVLFFGGGAVSMVVQGENIGLLIMGAFVATFVAGFVAQLKEATTWHERLGVIGAWILIAWIFYGCMSGGSSDPYDRF